jgi:hypothetical protein
MGGVAKEKSAMRVAFWLAMVAPEVSR